MASIWKWVVACKGPTIIVTKSIWNNLAPPKVQFLSWLAWRGWIKSSEFLQRIGVLNSNVSALCVFYKFEVESLNHVLLHCPKIWRIWASIVSWWNLS